MQDDEKRALEQELCTECEKGYAIGPAAVGYLSVTAETFAELCACSEPAPGEETGEIVYFATPEAAYDAALAAFKAYAADKSGALYWRIPPELGEKDGKFAFYMRLLISDMLVIKKAAAAS